MEPCRTAELFDRYADTYTSVVGRSIRFSGEPPEYFAQAKLKELQALLGLDVPQRLVDIGCGTGSLTALLGRAFASAEVIGVDLSEESVARAAQRCRQVPNVRVRAFTGQPLSDLDDVDVAVLANVLHHVAPEGRDTFLRKNVLPMLRPGGRVIVFEHNPYNPLTRQAVRACPFDADAHLLSRRRAIRLLLGAGLQIDAARYLVFFPRLLAALRGWEPRIGWLPIGAQYLVASRWRPS